MRIALYQPDIPQNTGTILRLAACTNVAVDIIGPTGFDMSDRALRRASLDYLDHVSMTRHQSWAAFEDHLRLNDSLVRLVLLTTKAKSPQVQMESITRYLLGKDEDEEGKEYRTSFNPDKDPLRVFLENLTAAMAAQAKKTLQL